MEGENKFIKFIRDSGLFFDNATLTLLYAAVSTKTPVLLRGPPGTGKTEVTRAIAQYLGAEYVFYQCTLGTTEDDLIYKLLPSEQTKSGVKVVLGALPEALKKSQKGKVVLVLDEFDKTRPTADAMLLDFLQNFRVSTRIDNESVIQGNPENLWVFLTSNDEREFSEPLLRRVSVIKLRPLTPKLVKEILRSKGVREDLLDLLIQLYKDTLNAGLRKPATVQELLQLARAIEVLGDKADWSSLVYSYVIKDDLEWQKFKEYLRSRETAYEEENEIEDITQYYERVSNHEDKREEQWTPKMPKLRVAKSRIELNVNEIKEQEEQREVSMIIEMNEDNYARVIKDFKPEPSDVPWEFGDFRIVKDESGTYIVKENPLSIDDVISSADITYSWSACVSCKESLWDIVAHIKHSLKLSETVVQTLVKNYKVIYYTRDVLRFKNDRGSLDFVLVRKQKLTDNASIWDIEIVCEKDKDAIRFLIERLIEESAVCKAARELEATWNSWASENKVYIDCDRYDVAKKIFEEKYKQKIIEKYNELRRAIAEKYSVDLEHVRASAEYRVVYGDGSWRLDFTVDSPHDKKQIVKAILEGR
jgi:MoxR-like ATPases